MLTINRRRFLKAAVAASSAFPLFTVAGTKASGKVLGANDMIRVAVAGLNGYGRTHIQKYLRLDKVQVTHLVDPDSSLFDARREEVRATGGNDPKCFQDIREALDDQNWDALSVATPNHWHALITIWACQAGKDVYVESPMSHNLWEGLQCVKAMKKYERVVQHGTELRSNETITSQIAAIRSGAYGKLLVAKARCCVGRTGIGFQPAEFPPATTFDLNLWFGPAPMTLKAFHPNLVRYDWHWFWDLGNGEIGNRGVHQLDIARWAIEGATLPRRTWSLGGRFLPGGPDQGETPNMLLSVYEYDEALVIFEQRNLVDPALWKDYPKAPPMFEGCEFYTTEGVIRPELETRRKTIGGRAFTRQITRGWKFYPNKGKGPEPVIGREVRVTPGGPFGSFIAAIRSGKPEDINANAEEGHYSSALCHLANVSYRSGQTATFDKPLDVLGDNKQVGESFEAMKGNLQAFGFRLDELTYRSGRVLTLDPTTGTINGGEEAGRFLAPCYREPFVVSDYV